MTAYPRSKGICCLVDSAKAAARGDDELFDIAPNADHICQVIVRGEKQASEDSTLQRRSVED